MAKAKCHAQARQAVGRHGDGWGGAEAPPGTAARASNSSPRQLVSWG
ncbi:hypothetical protein CGLO_13121 [Colletotrichum gloeosporioides Cg-14]|uniref:Uncharacterized protein n=1 Tax=Colletotrichum gloeosporioides (strain Cg-14) TaxID=1237896 RepID=T0LHQ3_COLGC|nr:hypothetical protein CGLO_13121 [Colletotrichum gloeosporioides Cg-14]